MNRHFFIAQYVAGLLCLILSACSESESPSLADIPSDAEYAAMLDLSAETIGCDPAMIMSEAAADIPSGFVQAIDLSRILIYKPAETRMQIIGMAVTDTDALHSALADAGWIKRKCSGEDCYAAEDSGEFGGCLILDRDAAWYLASKADIKAWRESRSRASSGKNLAETQIANYCLESIAPGKAMLRAFVNSAAIGIPDQQNMIFINSQSLTDRASLRLSARMVVASEKTVSVTPLGLLAPLGADKMAFRQLMTSGPALQIAAGIPAGTNWNGLVELAGSGLGTQNQGMLQTLLPYMNRLNGALALSVGPLTAASLQSDDIEQQTLLIYATLDGNAAQEAVNEINTNLREKGLSPTPRADGIYSFSLPDATYRYTARGNAFIFALNREIELSTPSTGVEYLPDGDDLRLTASLTLPQIENSARPPIITLTLTAEALEMNISSHGGSNPVEALLKYQTDLRNSFRTARESSPDYYDSYD